jgi:hypothetical protein
MMLKWPDRAKAAIRKLFEPLQDIDVYVEDTNDEPFYRCLLNHATNGKVKVARVFALGGRNAVLAAAGAHNQTARRAVFIVDGDLPWVKGEPLPEIVGLHQHEAYCVENLLLCERAVSTLLSQEIVVTEDEATRRLGYQKWCDSILAPLIELFAAFATVHDYDPTVPTVSQGIGVMCVKHRTPAITELDPVKVRRAKDRALSAAAAGADAQTVATRYQGLLARIDSMSNPLRTVSGKDFLLPLLDFHLQALGCRIKRKSLRVRLASSGEVDRFAGLANVLTLAARGYR